VCKALKAKQIIMILEIIPVASYVPDASDLKIMTSNGELTYISMLNSMQDVKWSSVLQILN